MRYNLIGIIHAAMNRKNLLFANAVCCLCYPLCYILLIVLPHGDEATRGSFYSFGVTILNIIYLLIMLLTLNTLGVLYSHINRPRKRILKVVFHLTRSIWTLYVCSALFLVIAVPGFLGYFHHYIRYTFFSLHWTMLTFSIVFAIGFSVLFVAYYSQLRIRYILAFLIPALLLFAFKVTMPFPIYIVSWAAYSGCQLLLYYSIQDSRIKKISWDIPHKMGISGSNPL